MYTEIHTHTHTHYNTEEKKFRINTEIVKRLSRHFCGR